MGVPKPSMEHKLAVGEVLQGRIIRAVSVLAAALVQKGSRQPSLVMDDARRFEVYITGEKEDKQ